MSSGPELGRQLRGPLLALLGVIAAGTAGYILIEGWSFTDAVYMVVISVTTVGFREVQPLSTAGLWFTAGLVMIGLATTWYALSAMVAVMVEGHLGKRLEQRRMERRLAGDRDHFIVCGFGRVGRQIAEELRQEGREVVVIDVNETALSEASTAGFVTVAGNAADDDVLHHAGLDRAAGLITAVASDADNVFVTLSARALCPDLPIVARAIDDEVVPKLRRAGATHVISPYLMAGRHMARLALRPTTVDFVESLLRTSTGGPLIEDLQVEAGAALAGATVDSARERFPRVTLLALQRNGETMIPLAGEVTLAAGDVLAVVGDEEALRELEGACAARGGKG